MRTSLVVVALFGAGIGVAAAADLTTGKRLFEERCSACHGATGGGDGPAAPAITPAPRNFRDPAFWKDHTLDQIRHVVKEGKGASSMMPPFGEVLSDAEIDDVVGWVATFKPDTGKPSSGTPPGDGKVSGAGPGQDAAGGADRAGGSR